MKEMNYDKELFQNADNNKYSELLKKADSMMDIDTKKLVEDAVIGANEIYETEVGLANTFFETQLEIVNDMYDNNYSNEAVECEEDMKDSELLDNDQNIIDDSGDDVETEGIIESIPQNITARDADMSFDTDKEETVEPETKLETKLETESETDEDSFDNDSESLNNEDKQSDEGDETVALSEEDIKKKKKKEREDDILSYVKIIVLALGIALFVNSFILSNTRIPSGSMENTIQKNDRLFGFRLAYLFNEPQRGDIIIFKWPDDPSQNYIKRVIGLPGETIRITDGTVYVNDEILDESEYLKETPVGTFGPYVVPEDSYFVLGDNRNNSNDARRWNNTYVSKKAIVAKALFRYYPKFKIVK